jgi:hypothetical protein
MYMSTPGPLSCGPHLPGGACRPLQPGQEQDQVYGQARTTQPTVGARSLPGISNSPSVLARVPIRRSWRPPLATQLPDYHQSLYLQPTKASPRTQIKNPEIPASESFLLLSVEELVDVSARWFEHLVWDPRKFVTWNFCPEEGRAVRCWGGAAACDTQIWCEEEMPVVTRSRLSAARGDGAGALPWGSASAAPALRHDAGAPREGVASKNHHHHHGLKEKLRALTQDYEQQKQKLAASQLRRSIRCLNAWEAINDENAEEEEDGGRVAKFRYDAFAQVPESAVLRENVAPPQARAPSNDGAVLARTTEPQAKENAVGRGANAMSCPIKKAVPALPVLPVPPARKLSLGGAVGGKLKAAGEVGAGTAEAAESRILVFVRLRPMSRKEKEAGSRSCVKIVNRKEVFLTESASENDYLRLKRGRDSHFCFDSVFPDSTTQAEVYSTS